MEEKREPLNPMAIERKIQLLRSKNVDNEIIALVKSDYEDGLTEDEVELYLNKNYDINQMKVLSSCLHNGVSEEMMTLLKESKMSGGQMQTALNYYEKGVPIVAIKEVVEKDDTAINMRRMLDVVLEEVKKVKEQTPEESEYVKNLVAQMEKLVKEINHQKNFVVQFAFRSGNKEDTISLIEALAHSSDKAQSDEIMITYRTKYAMKPAWVEQVENLLVALEMYRIEEEKAATVINQILQTSHHIVAAQRKVQRQRRVHMIFMMMAMMISIWMAIMTMIDMTETAIMLMV